MPRFDYLGAKNAGWDDKAIADYLTKQNSLGKDLYIDKGEFGSSTTTAPAAPKPEWRELPGNIVPSATKLAGDVVKGAASFLPTAPKNVGEAVLGPLNSPGAKALASTAYGAAQAGLGKLFPNSPLTKAKKMPFEERAQANASAVGQMLKDRYGSLDNIKKTIIEDPVGFAMDISIVGEGVGPALKVVGETSKIAKVAKAGDTITSVSKAINPITATAKVGMKGLAKVGEKVVAPFAKSAQPELAAKFKAIGAEAPAAATTKSPIVPFFESIAAKGFGGGRIVAKYEATVKSLNEFADNLVKEAGPTAEPTAIGSSFVEGRAKFSEGADKLLEKLYEKAALPKKGEEAIKLVTPEAKKIVDRILDAKKNAANTMGAATDLGFYKKLSNTLSKPLDAKVLQDTIREMNLKVGSFTDEAIKPQLKELAATLKEELRKGIKTARPELGKALTEADAANTRIQDLLQSKFSETIVKLQDQPDKIFNAIFNKSTSVEDIPRILEVVGQDKLPSIQAAIIDDIIQAARSKATELHPFTPASIERGMKVFGEDKLKAILTPEQFTALENIDHMAKALGKSQKVIAGSQTFFTSRIAAELVLLTQNPILALKSIVGDLLFSRFVSSPMGQQWLLEGLQGPLKFFEDLNLKSQRQLPTAPANVPRVTEPALEAQPAE